ncbi:MAG: dienelactone hydrolase family protein [Parvularculaceae bacterium]
MSRRNVVVAAIIVAALIAGAAFANREWLVLSALALNSVKRDLGAQAALIAPGVEVFRPEEAAGPFPVIIQFHGCSGFRPGWMKSWAEIATKAGFIAVAVDSNGPRGIDRERALKTVCAGKELIGQERAGDIAAAIEIAKRQEGADASRIVLAGWSHGAWSVMDYLALEGARKAPTSLKARPPHVSIAGAVLFYPYCGEGTWSRIAAWSQHPPTLMFVAGRDSVVSPEACRAAATKLRREGVPVDLVDYENADHAFDDATLIGGPYAYFYDEASATDSKMRVGDFLASIAAQQ